MIFSLEFYSPRSLKKFAAGVDYLVGLRKVDLDGSVLSLSFPFCQLLLWMTPNSFSFPCCVVIRVVS